MTDPAVTTNEASATPSSLSPESQPFSVGTSSLFQPVAPLGELAKESFTSGKDLVDEMTQIGTNAFQNLGTVMAEPGTLFQPKKTVSTLSALVGNVATAGMESAKTLATDTIGVATGAVGDVVKIGKEIATIWTEPSAGPKAGEGLFQPHKPLEELTSLGSKVLKSGMAIAGGSVGTGANVVKKVIGAGTEVLKKGLGIFKKKDKASEQ